MNDLPFDTFFSEAPAPSSDVVQMPDPQPKGITIQTPLLTISLNNTMSKSHIVKTGAFFNSLLFDAIANKLVTQIAELALQIQALVIGKEATVEDPTFIYAMFDESGSLLPEFCNRTTNIKKAEALFAEADAHVQTAYALKSERDKYFPGLTKPLQYAFNFNASDINEREITTLPEAVAYQRARSGTLARYRAEVQLAKEKKMISANNAPLSHEAMLGF